MRETGGNRHCHSRPGPWFCWDSVSRCPRPIEVREQRVCALQCFYPSSALPPPPEPPRDLPLAPLGPTTLALPFLHPGSGTGFEFEFVLEAGHRAGSRSSTCSSQEPPRSLDEDLERVEVVRGEGRWWIQEWEQCRCLWWGKLWHSHDWWSWQGCEWRLRAWSW